VKPDGKTISWQGERTKELINTSDPACYKGQSLPIDWTKAKIRLNGEVNGQNARGENYSAKATNLVRDFTCSPNGNQPHRHPFISGKLVYQPGSRAARTIDFGNGSCDFNITITVNGQTYAYTLP
jgi:hypothetical protein